MRTEKERVEAQLEAEVRGLEESRECMKYDLYHYCLLFDSLIKYFVYGYSLTSIAYLAKQETTGDRREREGHS